MVVVVGVGVGDIWRLVSGFVLGERDCDGDAGESEVRII